MAAKFYAVRKGRTTGIFTSWSQCQQQVTGYPGASFKSFPTRGEAQRFLETGFVGGQADVPQKAEANAEAVAYVDGSYHAGTGEFACGAVIFYQGEAFEISQKFNDPDLAAMRNVAGEIMRESPNGAPGNGRPIRKPPRHTGSIILRLHKGCKSPL